MANKPPLAYRALNAKGEFMDGRELRNMPKEISLVRLVEACAERGVDIHDVIAESLTIEMREDCEHSGMTMKAQSDLAWRMIDKIEPSKKAIDMNANINGKIEVAVIKFADIDPAQLEAAPVSDADMGGT